METLLGDTLLINENHSNAIELNLESTEVANEMLDELSEILSSPIFGVEKAKEIYQRWFGVESDVCGWEPLSDIDTVNFGTNDNVVSESDNEVMEENSTDTVGSKELTCCVLLKTLTI